MLKFVNLTEEEARAVNEVFREIPSAAKAINATFIIHDCEKGYALSRRGETGAVWRSDRRSLLRAVATVAEMGEREHYDLREQPAYEILGAMPDASRNAVPTVETLKKYFRVLALEGYNAVMLYTEDTYELDGYPYFGHLRGRYTHEELRELAELMSFFLGTVIYNEILLERLNEMSHTDALTGLNNRNAMIQRSKLLSQSQEHPPFGIINLDLNGLKTVNDDLGHDAGDQLLITAAEILKKYFYLGDLYRTGGDEFIVIATGISREAFDRKVQRLRQATEKESKVSFAIGTFWSDGTTDINTAFRQADETMYEDKKAYYAAHPEQRR